MNLKSIDAATIGFFKHLSAFFRRLTHRNNYFFARVALGVMALGLLVGIANFFTGTMYTTSEKDLPFGGIMVVLLCAAIYDFVRIGEAQRNNLTSWQTRDILFLQMPWGGRLLLLGGAIVIILCTIIEFVEFFRHHGTIVGFLWMLRGSLFLGFTTYVYLVEVEPPTTPE